MLLQRLDIKDGVIHIPPCCTHRLHLWCPFSNLKVANPIFARACYIGFTLCFQDAWNPSKRLHTWIAFQRPFCQFSKCLAVETERLSSCGIEGSQTIEHLLMLLHTTL